MTPCHHYQMRRKLAGWADGYTCLHLHQRVHVEEHKHSVIGKHFLEKHSLKRMNLNLLFLLK